MTSPQQQQPTPATSRRWCSARRSCQWCRVSLYRPRRAGAVVASSRCRHQGPRRSSSPMVLMGPARQNAAPTSIRGQLGDVSDTISGVGSLVHSHPPTSRQPPPTLLLADEGDAVVGRALELFSLERRATLARSTPRCCQCFRCSDPSWQLSRPDY